MHYVQLVKDASKSCNQRSSFISCEWKKESVMSKPGGISWNANVSPAPKAKGIVRTGPKAVAPTRVQNQAIQPALASKICHLHYFLARNWRQEPKLFSGAEPGTVWFLHNTTNSSGRALMQVSVTSAIIAVGDASGISFQLKSFVHAARDPAAAETQTDTREMFTVLYHTEPYAFRRSESDSLIRYRLPVVLFSDQRLGVLVVDRAFCVPLTNEL